MEARIQLSPVDAAEIKPQPVINTEILLSHCQLIRHLTLLHEMVLDAYPTMQSRLQVSAQWIMGAEVKLPPVTIPESLPEESKQVLRILSQMVVDCTQFEAQK